MRCKIFESISKVHLNSTGCEGWSVKDSTRKHSRQVLWPEGPKSMSGVGIRKILIKSEPWTRLQSKVVKLLALSPRCRNLPQVEGMSVGIVTQQQPQDARSVGLWPHRRPSKHSLS